MGFDVEAARKEGYSDTDIANHLAEQSGFDIAGARKEGHSDTDIIGHLSGAPVSAAPGQIPPGQTSAVGTGVLTAGVGALGEATLKAGPHVLGVKKLFNKEVPPVPEMSAPAPATGFTQNYDPRVQSTAEFNQQQSFAHADLAKEREFQTKKAAFEKANPGMTLTPEGLQVPLAAGQDLAKTEANARALEQARAEAALAARAKKAAPARAAAGPAGRIASYGLGGYGLEAGTNKLQQGDTLGGAANYIGAGSALAAPHLIGRKGLPGKLGKAAGALSILAPIAAEVIPSQAHGGLVHLADGGQPNGEAYAYEPSYNEQMRDKVAPYLGYQTAERLFGGPSAQAVDKYNPAAWIAQAPGAIAQAGKDFYESSKQGEYVPAMMSYLGGVMDASPMLSKAGKIASLLKYQGGNKAFEEGMERSAPYIQKGIQFLRRIKGEPKVGSVLEHAEGGQIGHYAPGGAVLKKFTEAIIPHEGKTLIATLADRTKATEGFHGGPGFINLHPEYTWAVDAPAVVSKHMNAVNRFGGPEQTIMAPMLMSSEAHKSNRDVFRQIYGDMANKIKSGEFTPEQIDKLNARILSEKAADLSQSPGVASPDFLQFADTFHRRGKVADILGLKKTGAVDLAKHLDETIDPALRGVETGAIGPQLFTMEGAIHKPDVHPSYEQLFLGQKGADQFTPVPREFLFRDLEKQAMEQMGRPMTDYNYRNVLNAQGGLPNQFIDEKLIRSLQDLGYKTGGLV